MRRTSQRAALVRQEHLCDGLILRRHAARTAPVARPFPGRTTHEHIDRFLDVADDLAVGDDVDWRHG